MDTCFEYYYRNFRRTCFSLLFCFCCIIGIVNACQGKAKGLPIFGKFKILH